MKGKQPRPGRPRRRAAMHFKQSRERALPWLLGLCSLVFSPFAQALGLGQASVNSYYQQPLDVRIDLISRSESEMATVTAGLASAADFSIMGLSSGAISVPLEFTINRDLADPHIRVVSQRPMNDPVVQLVVEVVWASGRMLRQYTIFLDPPTFKAPAPLPATPRRTEAPQKPVPETGGTPAADTEPAIAMIDTPQSSTSPFLSEPPAPLPAPRAPVPEAPQTESRATEVEVRQPLVNSGVPAGPETPEERPAVDTGPPFDPQPGTALVSQADAIVTDRTSADDAESSVVNDAMAMEDQTSPAALPEDPAQGQESSGAMTEDGPGPDVALEAVQAAETEPSREPESGPGLDDEVILEAAADLPVDPGLETAEALREEAVASEAITSESGTNPDVTSSDDGLDTIPTDELAFSDAADLADSGPVDPAIKVSPENEIIEADPLAPAEEPAAGETETVARAMAEEPAPEPESLMAEAMGESDSEAPELETPAIIESPAIEEVAAIAEAETDSSPGLPTGENPAVNDTGELQSISGLAAEAEEETSADLAAEPQASSGNQADTIAASDPEGLTQPAADPAPMQDEVVPVEERIPPPVDIVYRAVMPQAGDVATTVEVERGDTLWGISSDYAKTRSISVNQVMLAIQQSNPQAFVDDNINAMKSGAVLRMPEDGNLRSLSAREAMLEVMRQEALYRTRWDLPNSQDELPVIADLAQQSAPAAPSLAESQREIEQDQSDRLELVPPSESGQGSNDEFGQGNSGDDGVSSGESVVEELARAQEELANARQENSYLADRIEELEAELARNEASEERGVADTTLAEMENRLEQERLAEKDEPPVDLTPGDQPEHWLTRFGAWLGGGVILLIAALVLWLRGRRSDDLEVSEAPSAENAGSEETQPAAGSSVPGEPGFGDANAETASTDNVVPLDAHREETSEEAIELDVDDPETRLDLARAYLAMGRKDDVRTLLEAVLSEGNAEQVAEAKEMLSEL